MNSGLEAAALCGNKDMVNFFISQGADHLKEALHKAAEKGHKNLVACLLSKMWTDYHSYDNVDDYLYVLESWICMLDGAIELAYENFR